MTGEMGLEPAEAFAVLGSDTRVAIVEALGDAGGSLTFAALRERVGVADSGQFNYHLSKLRGVFVRRTDGGEYELTDAGRRVVGAILAGTYNRRGSMETFSLDSNCDRCGERVEAEYVDERVTVRCPTCDDQLLHFGFPPGAFEGRSRTELGRTFDRWIRDSVTLVADGICPNCIGVMAGRLVEDLAFVDESAAGIQFDCERCGDSLLLGVNAYLLTRSDVVAFYHGHGYDVRERRLWNLPCQRDDDLVVESSDPLVVRSTLDIDGDRLAVTLEDDLTIAEIDDTRIDGDRSGSGAGRHGG